MGLAPFGGEQVNFQRWIEAVKDDFSLKISAYDIFLEVAALEKLYDRGEGKPYLRPYLVDLAYKVQYEIEQALLHIVGLAMERTGLNKLCIAGGVGLNSVANYQLVHQLKLDDIFIFPAAGDSGIAAGCALWAARTVDGGDRRVQMTQAYLGRTYPALRVKQALTKFASDITVRELTPAETIAHSAQALAAGNVVARFEGGSEYGPRALGHRSIIADPTFKRMKDIVNARVKFREAFRPFAPVIPLESIASVFEQDIAAPFMLVVPQIKREFHDVIPGVTHVDGTGRVQTVTAAANPYFHRLCHELTSVRSGPPVLLNTSFNVAGQPIVETPEEAISTFLATDIDYLSIDNFWIAKTHVPVLNYQEHLTKVGKSKLPKGLPSNVPAVTELMTQLDRALFGTKVPTCPWSPTELKQLSAEGAIYKETSRLFPNTPGIGQLQTCLAPNIIILPDPLGKSAIVDLTAKVNPTSYTWEEVQLLLAVRSGNIKDLESLRQRSQLTPHELATNIAWAETELNRYQLTPAHSLTIPVAPDSPLTTISTQTFAPFIEQNFSARHTLRELHDCLRQAEYTAVNIANRLGVTSQQQLEPTRLHYYDRHSLPDTTLGNLIRLFHLRVSLPVAKLHALFGETLFTKLVQLGLFIPRDENWESRIDPTNEKWSSRVDLFEAAGLYIATDHRYMILPEDRIDEDPVMYLGMDSMGLVYTAPRITAERVLDLCTGSGVQALTASRYADRVVGVDINPRALRFARFNAQLNGIENVEFCLGNLYEAVAGRFDTILANPPFVPSPSADYRFRDGGANGEEILARIISGSADRLNPQGKLFIVTDLVDLPQYKGKLSQWWGKSAAHKLILHTADRDDILFSVPHSHAPFGQTICEYNAELDRWVQNFHEAGLTAVNFGYILIQTVGDEQKGSYYTRTIHNPDRPIYNKAQDYFQQRNLLARPDVGKYYLTIHPDLRFRCEIDPNTGSQQIEIFAPDNLYFTTYPIGNLIYLGLQEILQSRPQCRTYVNPQNRAWIYDLICKGVLVLLPTRPELNPDKPNLPVVTNAFDLASRGIERVGRSNHETIDRELSITELQTKTTPTCLSSYLR